MRSAVHDQSALIFLYCRFFASIEPVGCDGKLWSVGKGGGGSDFQMLAAMPYMQFF